MAIVGAYSDRGSVKAVDQDACCFVEAQTLMGRVLMAIMCDGVGGLSKGEVASTTLVHRFMAWFSGQLPRFIELNMSSDSFMDSLRNVWATMLQAACEDIYAYGSRTGAMLGTTFTGMMVVGGRYLIGHVGDCRAYKVSHEAFEQLTGDQTLVAQQLATGVITPEQAAHHPKRNVILQSVGTQETVTPEFVYGAYDPQATYVFCCDGFYNKLEQAELHRAFAPGAVATPQALQSACQMLVGEAMKRGEKDNVTVLAFTDAYQYLQQGNAQNAGVDLTMQSNATSLSQSIAYKAPEASEDAVAAQDEDESLTTVVDEEESPTVFVQGGGA